MFFKTYFVFFFKTNRIRTQYKIKINVVMQSIAKENEK